MTCSHNRVEATHMFCVDCGASTGAMVAALREQLASTDTLRANRDEWMERARLAEEKAERLETEGRLRSAALSRAQASLAELERRADVYRAILKEALRSISDILPPNPAGCLASCGKPKTDALRAVLARARQEGFSDD